MSQLSRRARVRQLADSVWPGRTVNGYANLIAARMRKLAEEGSTGMLPVSGRGNGAVFFRGGQVVYAESSLTAPPALRAMGLAALALAPGSGQAPAPPRPAAPGGGGQLVPAASVRQLASAVEFTELVIDALTELLSSQSRYAKFRAGALPPVGEGRPLAVETLVAEVRRRHEITRQLSPVLTADTAIACDPSLPRAAAQVTRAQWALLSRAAGGTTPRRLALLLGRSVFGTTIEAYRLLELGLAVVPGRPRPPAGGPVPRAASPLSFISAATGGRSGDD